MTDNPYAGDLGSRDPVQSLGDTPKRLEAIVRRFTPGDFARSYAPGKWSARQIVVHLAQTELLIQPRVRLALTVADYIVQPFEQDDVLALEPGVSGLAALDAYLAVRRFSIPMLSALTPAQLSTTCRHPESGVIDVRWILVMLAGHELRHLGQLEAVGAGQ